MKILITGAAGFIGYHLSKALLAQDHEVVGLDNINNYYDVNLKYARLQELGLEREALSALAIKQSRKYKLFSFIQLDLEHRAEILSLFERESFDIVYNLAAQAGVRYSIENPHIYAESNVLGFLNVLEACRAYPVKHLFYASSSSVYGNNKKVPFSESDVVDHPISLYAATKKSNELMAYTYSHLYAIPTTGMRFFTVYGPWGRPDMAYYKFAEAIVAGKAIDVYNNGNLRRDFTYIDDIISGMCGLLSLDRKSGAEIYNIGNNQPVKLMDFINCLGGLLETDVNCNYLPMQDGDVYETYADISKMAAACNYRPNTPIEEGLGAFVAWYRNYKLS